MVHIQILDTYHSSIFIKGTFSVASLITRALFQCPLGKSFSFYLTNHFLKYATDNTPNPATRQMPENKSPYPLTKATGAKVISEISIGAMNR